MLVNLARYMRYFDDLSLTQLLVGRIGHPKKDRLAQYSLCWLLILKTVPNVSAYPAGLPVSGATGCLEKLPL